MLHLYKTLGKMACGVKSKVMGGPLEKKDYIHDPRFVECRNCLRTKFFKKKLSAWGFSIHNDTIVPPCAT